MRVSISNLFFFFYGALKLTSYNVALRLLPPVPNNYRMATKDTTIPVGGGPDEKSPVYVKKGGLVAYSVYCMHRRTDYFGEDAKIFRPERWEENSRHGWDFLPFNGGPRICLGRKYSSYSLHNGELT